MFSKFLRKIHNIVTFSTKLQEVDIYFSFKVLRQYCQFLFVKYVELNHSREKDGNGKSIVEVHGDSLSILNAKVGARI